MGAESKSIIKPTIHITILSFVGIILNFITQLVIAYYFGTTPERDAYFAAMVLPTYLSSILVGSLGVMFLPTYVDIKTRKNTQQANVFFTQTLVLSIFISLIIIIIFSVFADNILSLTAPGFRDEQLSLTSNLLIIHLPTILIQIVTNIVGSVLQVQHRFIIPALNPVFTALISLFFVTVFSRFWGIMSLAYGVLIGNVIVVIIQLIWVRRSIPLRSSINCRSEEINKLLKVSAPLLITGIFYRLTGVFERGIGSTLPEGSISYLGYANQIMLILATITTSGIVTTIYPLLATAWSEKDNERLQTLFSRGVCVILLLTLPISIFFIFWGSPVIQILFERGAFTHESTIAVSSTFSIMTGAFMASCLGGIISRFFYFSHKTVTFSSINIIEILTYITCAFFLSKTLSYIGLSLALSISVITNVIISLIMLSVIYKMVNLRKTIKEGLYITIAGLLPALFIMLLLHFYPLDLKEYPFYIIPIAICFSVGYYIFLRIFKIDELNWIKEKMIRFSNF